MRGSRRARRHRWDPCGTPARGPTAFAGVLQPEGTGPLWSMVNRTNVLRNAKIYSPNQGCVYELVLLEPK